MANLEVNPIVKRSGGKGGIFGKIFGGLAAGVAAAAAPFTGGASLAAIPAVLGAAGTGAALGGLVGDVADPAKASNPTHVGNLESTKQDPGVQLAYLQEAQSALSKKPFPGSEEYLGTTNNAVMELKRRMGLK